MAERSQIFTNRATAGVALARELQRRLLRPPLVVLALPRGGVAVAYEVARMLHAPLDVMVVRKIGMPGQPELAIGAIASGGIVVHEPGMETEFPELAESFDRVLEEERVELERRERVYRPGAAALDLAGKSAILVDDGLATGATMLAAIRAARKAGAATIIVAAPVASPQAAALVRREADATVILETPAALFAIGQWFRDFEQLDDAEVLRLLELSRSNPDGSPGVVKQHRARG
ncbi:MAG TPA: phosphoribosyltransferase family protein [Steroidobacteraceae bacterium]|nr:phosphoribosyltransferase family protein [Steroidobacteraceae bacterium]